MENSFMTLIKSSFFIFFISYICRLFSFYDEANQQDQFIQAVSTLIFHMKEYEAELTSPPITPSPFLQNLEFSDEEIAALWDQAAHVLYGQDQVHSNQHKNKEKQFQDAYDHYYTSKTLLAQENRTEAIPFLTYSHTLLFNLWDQACEEALHSPSSHLIEKALRKQTTATPSLSGNKAIPDKAKKKMRPYVIPSNHPMKEKLDAIFTASRATLNETSFAQAGFTTICARPRTFIKVASHPLLPSYLVKVNLDSELRQKQGKESWKWLVERCKGAEKIRHIIHSRQIKHFVVADKWIYPLPEKPAPIVSPAYTRHLAILLVTDMNLTDREDNLYAWLHNITEEHLDELYTIISYAKGSSYRPDNISYTKNGQFAFIDTEYPSKGPDYKSIRHFLNSNMVAYWDRLVKKGGKHP